MNPFKNSKSLSRQLHDVQSAVELCGALDPVNQLDIQPESTSLALIKRQSREIIPYVPYEISRQTFFNAINQKIAPKQRYGNLTNDIVWWPQEDNRFPEQPEMSNNFILFNLMLQAHVMGEQLLCFFLIVDMILLTRRVAEEEANLRNLQRDYNNMNNVSPDFSDEEDLYDDTESNGIKLS